MEIGTLTLETASGSQSYRLRSADSFVYRYLDLYELNFLVRTEENDQGFSARASLSILLELGDSLELSERSFVVPTGWDERHRHRLSNFYLHEHEPLRDSRLEIRSSDPTRIKADWSAVVSDNEVYDGTAPDTKVRIEAVFTRHPEQTIPYRLIQINTDPRLFRQGIGLISGFAMGGLLALMTGWLPWFGGSAIGGLLGFGIGNHSGEREFMRRLHLRG
jgi:hypothetical protein